MSYAKQAGLEMKERRNFLPFGLSKLYVNGDAHKKEMNAKIEAELAVYEW